ncbi:hypothetical protein PR048_027406 [Dryococelus australis]|uniref:Uncharacterized protein n=1 Tax=Dryococelus australis TaxID=614101 RepID=A0ABQ9GFD9_9NEOP|nr:hypothetical protein PR048_027406 [Dryococelus australis]
MTRPEIEPGSPCWEASSLWPESHSPDQHSTTRPKTQPRYISISVWHSFRLWRHVYTEVSDILSACGDITGASFFPPGQYDLLKARDGGEVPAAARTRLYSRPAPGNIKCGPRRSRTFVLVMFDIPMTAHPSLPIPRYRSTPHHPSSRSIPLASMLLLHPLPPPSPNQPKHGAKSVICNRAAFDICNLFAAWSGRPGGTVADTQTGPGLRTLAYTSPVVEKHNVKQPIIPRTPAAHYIKMASLANNNVGEPFVNLRLVTYSAAGNPDNRDLSQHGKTCSSDIDCERVPGLVNTQTTACLEVSSVFEVGEHGSDKSDTGTRASSTFAHTREPLCSFLVVPPLPKRRHWSSMSADGRHSAAFIGQEKNFNSSLQSTSADGHEDKEQTTIRPKEQQAWKPNKILPFS